MDNKAIITGVSFWDKVEEQKRLARLVSDADSTTDKINPNHYKQGNIEVIDFILDQEMNYLEGNIIKYVSRYKRKNGLEDLEKARWYIEELIDANS
jgi:hypothetical protein